MHPDKEIPSKLPREVLDQQIQNYLASGRTITVVPGFTPKAKSPRNFSLDPMAIARSRDSFHNRLDRILGTTPLEIDQLAQLAQLEPLHLRQLVVRQKIGTTALLEKIAKAILYARK